MSKRKKRKNKRHQQSKEDWNKNLSETDIDSLKVTNNYIKTNNKNKKNTKNKQMQKLEEIKSTENFENEGDKSLGTKTGCNLIQRLIVGLKYYESLQDINNHSNKQKFIKYCKKTYRSFLDDYIHLITNHSDDLDEIYDSMIKEYQFNPCNVTKCILLSRHNRDRRTVHNLKKKQSKNDANTTFVFYCDVFDSIHCYLLHSFDIGLRIRKEDKIKNAINDIDDKQDIQYVDNSFAAMKQIINTKKQQLMSVKGQDNRFKNNSKYTLKCNSNKQTKINSEALFMDDLIHFVKWNVLIYYGHLNAFKKFLDVEEYDTDSFLADIDADDDSKSNVGIHLNHASSYDSIKQYLHDLNLNDSSFSIGYIFYYWSYYEKIKDRNKQFYANKNTHSGYSPGQLFISSKYGTLKEEILNNKQHTLNIDEFMMSLNKAEQYMTTTKTKRLTTGKTTAYHQTLHYGIKDSSSITMHHLLSVILYCDWSVLCKIFSSTFRPTKSSETLQSLKKRNREFAIWSRLLRETVECWGQKGYDPDEDDKWNKDSWRVKGPFYCGMSFEMVIPQFNIRLCGPTSTSKKIEVATRFGGDKGIIIQLNNNGYFRSEFLRSFNCSWVSNYSVEDEYLFIGGLWPIKIEGIRCIETVTNYHTFFKPLFYLDCMVSGITMNHTEIEGINNDTNFSILDMLMKQKNEYPKYVNNTFTLFTNHKTQIVINLHYLHKYFEKLKDLIITKNNKIKPIILKLFKNINEVIIYTTRIDGKQHYLVDLNIYTSLLQKSRSYTKHNLKFTIKATHQYHYRWSRTRKCAYNAKRIGNSWLHELLYNPSSSSSKIKHKCHGNNCKIDFIQTTDGSSTNKKEDNFVITRHYSKC